MSEEFLKTQIISPDNQVYDGNTEMVVLPGDEGDFAAMYEHAPIITFLRPGFIVIKSDKEEKEEKYYVEEGTVEFSRNNLLILSSTAKDMNKFNKSSISGLIIEAY